MAEQNPGGSKVSAAQRTYNFAANGGGAVTYRVLVSALSLMIATLVGLMWNDIHGTLAQINLVLNAQANMIAGNTSSIAVHERRLNDGDASRTLLWQSVNNNRAMIGDHEHRITIIEARSHVPR